MPKLIVSVLLIVATDGLVLANDECAVESVFLAYQTAVYDGQSNSALKKYITVELAELYDHLVNDSSPQIAESVRNPYESGARKAQHVYDHQVLFLDDVACLAVDGISEITSGRINVVYVFRWQSGSWKLADYYPAKATNNEKWKYVGRSDHSSVCLRHDWALFAKGFNLPRDPKTAHRLLPACSDSNGQP